MSDTWINIPAVASPRWKSPVVNAAALPSLNNTAGDARVALDTQFVYVWSGSGWTLVAGGSSGSVTSVGLAAPAIFTVSGSPVTSTGTLTLTASGTSGGVPYFNASNTLASSGALTQYQVVLGGGAGGAPNVVSGTGTATQVLTSNGAGANPTWQAAGGGGSISIGTTVTSGTANSVLYLGTSNVLAQDTTNFVYDFTNIRWGYGTNAPGGFITAVAPAPASIGTTPGTTAAVTGTISLTAAAGGATSAATSGTGGIGGGFLSTAGAGGASSSTTTAATGGAGGVWTGVSGGGGAVGSATSATRTAGTTGAVSLTSAAGTAVTGGSSTSQGGATGTFTIGSGNGAQGSGSVGSNRGGASGALSALSGTGGAGASGGTVGVGGASGSFTAGSGNSGAASGGSSSATSGATGNVILRSGNSGSATTSGTGSAASTFTGTVSILTGSTGVASGGTSSNVSGNTGAILIQTGTAANSNGASGVTTVTGGNAGAINVLGGGGGNADLPTNTTANPGSGAPINITGGPSGRKYSNNGAVVSTAVGGPVNITGGIGGGVKNDQSFGGGNGSTAANGGTVTIQGGLGGNPDMNSQSSNIAGSGGPVVIRGGQGAPAVNGSLGVQGDGASVFIIGGTQDPTNSNHSTLGVNGSIIFQTIPTSGGSATPTTALTIFPSGNATFAQGVTVTGTLVATGNISMWTNDAGYITASSTDALTNKSGNISMWTNDAGYITSGVTFPITAPQIATPGAPGAGFDIIYPKSDDRFYVLDPASTEHKIYYVGDDIEFFDNSVHTTRQIFVHDQSTTDTNANNLLLFGGAGNGIGNGSDIILSPGLAGGGMGAADGQVSIKNQTSTFSATFDTSNLSASQSFSFPSVTGTLVTSVTNSLGAQTTDAAIVTLATPPAGVYMVGGNINVTAFTAGTQSLQVSYKDSLGNAQVLILPLIDLTGVISQSIGSQTVSSAVTTSIFTDGSANIVISTVGTGFTGTYDASAFVQAV